MAMSRARGSVRDREDRWMPVLFMRLNSGRIWARPGARRESLETYLKRIKTLEELAHSFEGVSECYALQAGREVRIIVKPEDIDDLDAIHLSKEIAKKIEEDMQYPGQINTRIMNCELYIFCFYQLLITSPQSLTSRLTFEVRGLASVAGVPVTSNEKLETILK